MLLLKKFTAKKVYLVLIILLILLIFAGLWLKLRIKSKETIAYNDVQVEELSQKVSDQQKQIEELNDYKQQEEEDKHKLEEDQKNKEEQVKIQAESEKRTYCLEKLQELQKNLNQKRKENIEEVKSKAKKWEQDCWGSYTKEWCADGRKELEKNLEKDNKIEESNIERQTDSLKNGSCKNYL